MDISNPFATPQQPQMQQNQRMQIDPNNPLFNQYFGGYNNFQTQLNQMAAQVQQASQSPQQAVQAMLNSGQMTPQMFEAIRPIANMLTGMNK